MPQTAKTIIIFALTYFFTKLISRLAFNPYAHLSFWPALLVDLFIWLAVFALCSAVANKYLNRLFR